MNKPTKTIYIPAVSCSGAAYLKMDDKKVHENVNITKSIRFTNKKNSLGLEPYVYHPYILFTAAYYYKEDDVRKSMGVDPEVMLFLDSGGFQLMTGKTHKNFDKKVSLEWCEKNGDIFPILDFPAPKKGSNIVKFNKSLDVSCESAKFYYENRSVSGKILLNVISGSTLDSIELWYNRISQWKFDGWCHGSHQGGLKAVLKGIFFMLNKGELNSNDKPIHYHVFGLSSSKLVPYLALLQRELNKLDGISVQILFDSSYFQKTAAYGNMMTGVTQSGLDAVRVSNRYDYDKASNLVPNSSDVFKEPLKDVQSFFNTPIEYQSLMSLNNLEWVLKNKEYLDRLVDFGEDRVMLAALAGKTSRNFIRILELFKDPKNAEKHIEASIEDVNDGNEPVNTIDNFI